ncbi:MAG: glycoside hydrolase family protein [Neisseriaceae bacterium]|nr:glycoside hydrolase family protein [Neisseriaceae bacterium]
MNILIKILQVLFTKRTTGKRYAVLDDEKQEAVGVKVKEQRKPSVVRIAATALTIATVSLLTNIETQEGYVKIAKPDPVGIPTGGHGTIKYRTPESGKKGQAVKNGDIFTRELARAEVVAYLDEQGQRIIESLKKPNGEFVELYQQEFDIIQDFVYNFGFGNWQKSSIRQAYLNGEYLQACDNYLKYKYAGGKDCSVRANGCYGVWIRSQKRREDCLNAGAPTK